MSGYIKVSGAWKTATAYYIKIGGSWKTVSDGYVKISGAWKKFFAAAVAAPINTVAPVASPSSGPAGSTTFSTTDGTWSPDDADGVYAYQWQYNDQGALWLSISGATSSTYTPSSNYVSLYGSSLRCRVTATNATGSTSATSNQVTVTVPVPAGGTVSISPSGTQLAGTTLTVSTSGWSNSPTSYNLRLYASTSNPPSDGGVGSVLITSTASSSLTYTITTSDATAPAYYFKAFATASNAGGASSQVESNVVLSALPSAPSGGSVTLSPSGTQYAGTTLTASTFGWSGSPTTYNLRIYASTSNPPSAGGAGSVLKTSTTSSSLAYTITNSDAAGSPYYFKAFATATNTGGTSADAESNVVLSAPLPVAPSGGSVTLSGTGVAGTSLTAVTSGWSGSPTSYNVYIYASTSSPPFMSDTLKASSTSSSVSYTVTTFDANPPAYYFKAFATATNGAGTSTFIAQSNVILSSLPAGAVPVLVSLTGNNALSLGGTFSWSFSNSPTAYSLLVQGPTGTVYTTSNAYTYTGTTFRPAYDGTGGTNGTGWQGSGNYTIYISARNSSGNSTVSSQTTAMS